MLIHEKTEIYGRTVQNRVVLHPMEGCDGNPDGSIGELTRRRYLRFAESHAGIIWFEATAVSPECRANPRQLHINENNKDSFRELVSDIKRRAKEVSGFEPLIILQATNSGRWSKPEGTPAPIIAYHNPLWEKGKEDLPYILAADEYCDGVVQKYAEAARLASYAGFDGIDVKCCHGYLMNELLSAYHRPGKYGGSFENRTRLYFDCLQAVLENKDENVFVTTRLNACDCFDYPYGFGVNENNEIDLTETKRIIGRLKEMGIELINVTLGNPYLIPHINRPCINAPEPGEVGEKRIYDVTKELQQSFPEIRMILSGLSFLGENCIDYAEKALEDGVCSFAGFGRMSFCYPTFYADYLEHGRLDKGRCCLSCAKCTALMRHGAVAGCPMRDSEVYLPIYRQYVTGK